MRRSGIGSALMKMGVLLLSVFVSFVVLELLTRLFSPDWLDYRMNLLGAVATDAAVGSDAGWPVEMVDGEIVKFKPRATYETAHFEYRHKVSIDAFGGRVAGACKAGEAQKITPFLGDSFTFGIGVEDDETFVSLLNAKTDACLLNLGIPGASVETYTRLVRLRHQELGSPDFYVLNVFLGNDFTLAKDDPSEEVTQEDPQAVEDQQTAFWRLERFLAKINDHLSHNPIIKQSYFIQFVRAKSLVVYNRIKFKVEGTERLNSIFIGSDRRNRAAIHAGIKADFLKYDALARELNFDFLTVLLPDVFQVDDELRGKQSRMYGIQEKNMDVTQLNSIYKEVIEEAGRDYLDVTQCFKKAPHVRDLYYVQDNHYTQEGHEVVAACFPTTFMDPAIAKANT